MKEVIRYITKRKSFLKGITALTLAMVIFILPSAAGFADVSEALEGPFTLNVGLSTNDEDLKKVDLKVNLYKIASAEKMDKYDSFNFVINKNEDGTEDSTYKEIFDNSISKKDIDAAEWQKVAQEAAKIALGSKDTAAQEPTVKSQSIFDKDGKVNPISVPEAGLYLVAVEGRRATQDDGRTITIVYSANKRYSFLPQLISFPSKDVAVNDSGESVINTANPGEWLRDVTINLKPGEEQRNGGLDIVKGVDLLEMKEPETFVFHVKGEDNEGTVVFDNTYSMVFSKDSDKSQKLSIDGIPVGTVVTVTEEYSGRNYRSEVTEKKAEPISANEVRTVEFTNTYNDTYKGGGSIENVFEKSGDTWRWHGVDSDGKEYNEKNN